MAPGQALDREEKASYQLKIVASDMGLRGARSSTGLVKVEVEDVNDSRPRFSTVRETIEVSPVITTVSKCVVFSLPKWSAKCSNSSF